MRIFKKVYGFLILYHCSQHILCSLAHFNHPRSSLKYKIFVPESITKLGSNKFYKIDLPILRSNQPHFVTLNTPSPEQDVFCPPFPSSICSSTSEKYHYAEPAVILASRIFDEKVGEKTVGLKKHPAFSTPLGFVRSETFQKQYLKFRSKSMRHDGNVHQEQNAHNNSAAALMIQEIARRKWQESKPNSKIKIIFVCLGNICRSPAAEAILKKEIEKRQLKRYYSVDSCGTGGGYDDWYKPGGRDYEKGNNADSRMIAEANKRDIIITSISRPLCEDDVLNADIILGMDQKNIAAIEEAAQYWGCLHEAKQKTALLGEFRRGITGECIVDPYWGGIQQFEKTLDLIEESVDGLLTVLEAVNPHA